MAITIGSPKTKASSTSLYFNKSRHFTSRKKHDREASPAASQFYALRDSGLVLRKLPVIPPEIWSHILGLLPIASLWRLRRTCRLFNVIAIVDAWQLFCDSEIAVRTFFKSVHNPLSHIGDVAEMLKPVIPPSLSSYPRLPSVNDSFQNDTEVVTWRIAEETKTDFHSMRYSYKPFSVEIRFGGQILVQYEVGRLRQTRERFNNDFCTERFLVESKIPILSKFFPSKRNKTKQIYRFPMPDWGFTYIAQYGAGTNDDGELVRQLVGVTLQEVSLPISQIVRTFIEGIYS